MNRNCPNCAAPYEASLNKCPYCGTSYYDLSALDLDAREPFYLKIKTNVNGKIVYITQLVRPEGNGSINVESNTVCCYGKKGERLHSFQRDSTIITSLSFVGIPDKNGTIISIEEEA